MSVDPQQLLRELFATAIDAAHPHQVLEAHLPADRSGRVIVIGAGKAAAAMAQVVERCWQGEVSGLVVTRYGHGAPCEKIEVVEAAHPVPDAAGLAVAKRVLELVSNLTEDDRVIFLLSGGGSALLALPAEGITLADKQSINKALLKSGATIGEMNCVRKHLSAIKGGRLGKACWPATVYTYDFRCTGRPRHGHRFRPDRGRPEHFRRSAGNHQALRHRHSGVGAHLVAKP